MFEAHDDQDNERSQPAQNQLEHEVLAERQVVAQQSLWNHDQRRPASQGDDEAERRRPDRVYRFTFFGYRWALRRLLGPISSELIRMRCPSADRSNA